MAEVEALAGAVPRRYRAAVLVAAWSGLRPGEVFALRRRDVEVTDPSTAVVHVRRTVVELPGQPLTFGTPKTRAGRRSVALPPFVATALAEHLATHTGPDPDALVFTTTTGTPVTASARSAVLRGPRTRIARPDATWHHLRHTGATLAAQAGATTAELQARIGHTTHTAASRYQHATTDRDTALAHKLHTLATGHPSVSVVAGRESA
ncbi:site-specific integrase [Salana multivorans]